MLYAFMVNHRNHTSLVVRRCTKPKSAYNFVEIHGPSRLQIAAAARALPSLLFCTLPLFAALKRTLWRRLSEESACAIMQGPRSRRKTPTAARARKVIYVIKLNVPEEFVEVLRKIEADVKPRCVIGALEWATKNPEKARKVAEGFSRLGYLGRKEFETCIWLGNDPDYALKSAEERQADASKIRSLLGKALAEARRGGYRFRMPNGVECTVKYREGCYELTFNPGGAEVKLVRESNRHLSYTLTELLEGRVSPYKIDAIIYKGKAYHAYSSQGKVVLKAIEENVSPEVLVATGL